MGKPKHLTNKQNPFAKKKRNNKAKSAEQPEPARREKPYESIVPENESFEAYYKHQQVCDESEWPLFMEHLRSSLPVTFRITGSKAQAKLLLKITKESFFAEYDRAVRELRKDEEGGHVEPPRSLEWYPNELAWQLELSRKDIRRSEPLFRLHNFLISETNSGNISRQEAVSMIPPLVLDVQPHHKVLDMCAAPGSKTAQLIESLHGSDGAKIPSGFVIANDVDNNRCYMLVHQAKRLSSPCFMVTNADSSTFPVLQISQPDGTIAPLKYDRILCDVPCSGDGTMRKNPDIWTKWSLNQANNLHGLQHRILKRGAELLAVGGKLVYSTCSLNPIENEAVLHRLLKQSEGALELSECANLLPSLKYRKGMTYWEPATKDLKYYKTFADVPENQRTVVRPDMFPPSAEEAIEKYHLDRALRILPHHQNTGGFFIALLEKKKSLPWEAAAAEEAAREEEKRKEQTAASSGPPSKKARYMRGFKEDPFVFFEQNEEVFDSIKRFYQLDEAFDAKNFLTRCRVGKKKNIYFCSPAVRDVVQLNEKRIKFINLGVKSFVRCDNRNMQCEFRLASEGLASVNGFIGKQRRVTVDPEDLIKLLSCTDPTKPPEISSLTEGTQENLKNFDSGCCILECQLGDLPMATVGWKGTLSLRAYVDQHDTVHLLRLLGGDLSKFEKNKFQDKLLAEEAADDPEENGATVERKEEADTEEKIRYPTDPDNRNTGCCYRNTKSVHGKPRNRSESLDLFSSQYDTMITRGLFASRHTIVPCRVAQSVARCTSVSMSDRLVHVQRRYASQERNVVKSPFGKVDIPRQNVTEYIFEGYEKYADKPAITCGASKRSYTYGMTYEMIKRMACGLLSQKGCAMRKTDVLGLLLPNIPEFVPALHGGLLAGLTVTFANPLYTPEEVCRQFENAGVTVIVTLPLLLPVAELFKAKVKQYKGTICIGGKHDFEKNIYGFEQFLMENHSSELPEIDCDATAILPYSSGTTGLPKGVELTHYNLVANLAQGSHPQISKYYQPEYANRKETILTIPPYFHIYGLNGILHSVLKSKNHVISIPRIVLVL
ncbi:tRNA methyltransferase [Anopheles darlingi]|uniref:tRNA (cytosine(34)-C(5))-methyltransferase n=1 Tax=Anopheles darlingi TaxID=43151 RepID=W5JBT3_ANODA|nr:tRNA methyltransferase [Anopheles darlingi]